MCAPESKMLITQWDIAFACCICKMLLLMSDNEFLITKNNMITSNIKNLNWLIINDHSMFYKTHYIRHYDPSAMRCFLSLCRQMLAQCGPLRQWNHLQWQTAHAGFSGCPCHQTDGIVKDWVPLEFHFLILHQQTVRNIHANIINIHCTNIG